MNDLIPFDYSGKTVRVVMDENGNPWWMAKDVCEVLGIVNPRDAISALDNKEKSTVRISDAIGRMQNTNTINEPGLYRLIARSTKPKAKEFQRWVFHDVLPSIRKTGQYSLQETPKLHDPPQTYIEALQNLIIEVEKNERLSGGDTEYF